MTNGKQNGNAAKERHDILSVIEHGARRFYGDLQMGGLEEALDQAEAVLERKREEILRGVKGTGKHGILLLANTDLERNAYYGYDFTGEDFVTVVGCKHHFAVETSDGKPLPSEDCEVHTCDEMSEEEDSALSVLARSFTAEAVWETPDTAEAWEAMPKIEEDEETMRALDEGARGLYASAIRALRFGRHDPWLYREARKIERICKAAASRASKNKAIWECAERIEGLLNS